jgi:hypothetical protein
MGLEEACCQRRIDALERGFTSMLAQAIGSKGYRAQVFSDGPYPVERAF